MNNLQPQTSAAPIASHWDSDDWDATAVDDDDHLPLLGVGSGVDLSVPPPSLELATSCTSADEFVTQFASCCDGESLVVELGGGQMTGALQVVVLTSDRRRILSGSALAQDLGDASGRTRLTFETVDSDTHATYEALFAHSPGVAAATHAPPASMRPTESVGPNQQPLRHLGLVIVAAHLWLAGLGYGIGVGLFGDDSAPPTSATAVFAAPEAASTPAPVPGSAAERSSQPLCTCSCDAD